MTDKTNFRVFSLFIFIMTALLCLPAGAQDDVIYYSPITDISLNVKELTMNVGDQITLSLTYEPAETPNIFLKWYMDEKTIMIDPESYTVTALSAGSTRLLVESDAGFAWDFCDIIVTGSASKYASGKKAGTELIMLSDADRGKVKAGSVLRYLDFIEKSSFVPEDFEELSERRFNITAVVKPGTVAAQSELASSLGMEKSLELPDFSAVSLYGTLQQILDFTKNNDDLIRLFEFEPMLIDDPIPEQDDGQAPKGMNLQDNVEALTSVSKAHDLGLKGDNTAVAIIDSGLNKEHEQFKGRVVAEYCAGLSGKNIYPSCSEGSSEPTNTKNPASYTHGSHVAGIAAGRDGIAPNAKIISINHSSEACSEEGDLCLRFINFSIWEVGQYLADLQKEYKDREKLRIAAVNLSFGPGNEFDESCDDDYEEFKQAFDLLLDNDIIPVVASGNSGFVDAVQPYACLSNSFSVGALADNPTPTIRGTSCHGQMVDILAPGTKIWSALLTDDGEEDTVCSGINCYGHKSGTSMAAPMVTGAFAILRQANPDMTASELESLIKTMSGKSADHRLESKYNPEMTFSYSKPVLDFSDIENHIAPTPEPYHGPVFWWLDMEVLPRTGFSSKSQQALNAMPENLKYEPMDMILELPTLDVLSEIVVVPVMDNEYAVTWLDDAVGILEGSAQPGKGTVILAAHNHLNDTETGPFALLSSMKEGERIFIRDNENNLLRYSVYANEKVAETDFETVDRIAEAFDNTLIMITCEDERISGGYASRRIVAAKIIQ